MILLNTSKLEYETLNNKFNEFIDIKNEIRILQHITNFAEEIQAAINIVLEKYEKIKQYIPRKELQ